VTKCAIILSSIICLTGCLKSIPDDTQSERPPIGLIDICLRDAAKAEPTISNDPICIEAMRKWGN